MQTHGGSILYRILVQSYYILLAGVPARAMNPSMRAMKSVVRLSRNNSWFSSNAHWWMETVASAQAVRGADLA